jgi:V-type H+-transporting ATPase subunit a
MKMAIIFGVIHMSFAICLNVPNHLHFKNKRFIIAEWLPQILFMESLFGAFALEVFFCELIRGQAT